MINAHQNKRLFSTLDGMRGIAAILVLMRHIHYFGDISFQESYLAVDLFFILSGVVIANAYEKRLMGSLSPLEFIWFRLVRIYPMYLLGCLITLAYWLVNGGMPVHYLSIIVFALFLLPRLSETEGFQMDPPAWSLFSEIIANIVFGCCVRWLSNRVLIAIMTLSAAGLMYALHLHGNLDIGFFSRTIIFGVIRVGYSFFAGVLIFRLYQRGRPLLPSSGIFQIVPWLVMLAVVAILTSAPPESVRVPVDFLLVTLAFPCLVGLALCLDPQRKTVMVFKFLGAISYPLYAIHAPLGHWIPSVLGSGAAYATAHETLSVGLAYIVFLLPVCWLLDRYADGPARRIVLGFGARIGDGWTRAALAWKRKVA